MMERSRVRNRENQNNNKFENDVMPYKILIIQNELVKKSNDFTVRHSSHMRKIIDFDLLHLIEKVIERKGFYN